MDLYRSGEDYLKTMLVLAMEKGEIRSLDVSKHMKVTKASVSKAVRVLEEGGFLTMDKRKRIHLTDLGQQVARKMYDRHCMIREALLYFGIEPETAEQDACRIEHDISAQTFEKLKELWTKHKETISA